MYNLDHLIPLDILEMMQLDRFDFVLTLTSEPCNSRWPNAKVSVNNEVVFDGIIKEYQQINYNAKFDNINEVYVDIEYYNKQDNDTTVDANGSIIENKSITISELTVNDINLVKTRTIYNLGFFHQNLSPEKQQYFIDHGINFGPSHTLHLAENGVWKLKFQMPVMQEFVRHKASQAPSERWPNPKLLSEIYALIEDIRRLTKK
jgi:hypothetical protein